MTCYNPRLVCYNIKDFKNTGKKNLCFDVLQGESEEAKKVNYSHYPLGLYEYIKIPCGKCVGCRSSKAKEWAIRCFQEAQTHEENCFITLTYDDNSDLVKDDPMCLFSLRYKHFQNFMKRLRKRFPDDKIRFICSGEYGSKSGRAHFHAILFGFNFPDRKLYSVKKGYQHFVSDILQECWSVYDKKTDTYTPIGYVDLANVDVGTCQYVAQYVLKKLPEIDDKVFIELNGQRIELLDRCPEFIRMSNRRGIAYEWFNKFGKNAVLKQEVVISDNNSDKVIKALPPKYYEKLFDEIDHDKMEEIKSERTDKMKKYYEKYSITKDKLLSWMEAHLYRIKKSRQVSV